jgi:DNA-binding NarL/FixJ family response regulator
MWYPYTYDYPADSRQTRVIFLIDDDPIQLEMTKFYLSERFSLQIFCYESGHEALANINLNPDIVLLDFHLNAENANESNGIEILKKIRNASPSTIVIMLSGQDKISVALECIKNGAYDYIIKGESSFVRIENLFNNIDQLLDNIYYRKALKLTMYISGLAAMILIGIFIYYIETHKIIFQF